MAITGRPPNDRRALLALLERLPRCGRYTVRLNERDAARALGWHRTTVIRAVVELEASGELIRLRGSGCKGVLLALKPTNEPLRSHGDTVAEGPGRIPGRIRKSTLKLH